MKEPESMDECFYFTNRIVDNGYARAWAFKPDCPKCGKSKLGKPVDKKTGKVKTRSDEYQCPSCGYTAKKDEIDPTLDLNIDYKCPKCGNQGQTTTPYKRKKFQGVDAYLFTCQKCSEKIPITKKMKELKEE